MRKGKILLICLLFFSLFKGLYGQDTYFRHCYRYPHSEKNNSILIEDLYSRALGYLNDANVDSLRHSALQINSLTNRANTLYLQPFSHTLSFLNWKHRGSYNNFFSNKRVHTNACASNDAGQVNGHIRFLLQSEGLLMAESAVLSLLYLVVSNLNFTENN